MSETPAQMAERLEQLASYTTPKNSAACRAGAAALRAQAHGWQDIASAPKGREVLIWKPTAGAIMVAIHREGRWCLAWDFQHAGDPPTHWMPLPPPPLTGAE